jgi:hypothetical protein
VSNRHTRAAQRSGSASDGGHSAAGPADARELPAIPDSDRVRDLLRGYLELLDAVAEQRRRAGPLRRVWVWATERFATERVRRGLDALERRYRARRAIGGPLDPVTTDDRERVGELAAALPAAPSRLRLIWLGVAGLLLVRIVLGVAQSVLPSAVEAGTLKIASSPSAAALPSFPTHSALAPVVTVINELAALSPAAVGQLVDVMFKTSVLATSIVLTIVAIAAYVVLRPLACGASAAWILCHGSTGGRRWPVYADERRRAATLRIGERERAAFAPIGMDAPADSRVDLLVKACLPASMMVIAAGLWHLFLGGGNVGSDGGYGSRALEVDFTRVGHYPSLYGWVAATVASLAALRLTWLARELHRREVGRRPPGPAARGPSRPRAALAYALPLLTLTAAFALYSIPDQKAPSVWVLISRHERRLNDGFLDVRFACDEPCHLRAARLLRPGRGFARPWPRDSALASVEDHPYGRNPEMVRDAVGKLVSSDVTVSQATSVGSWYFNPFPGGRPLWPKVRNGTIVPELRFADTAGNSTTVPLWWGPWICNPGWRTTDAEC